MITSIFIFAAMFYYAVSFVRALRKIEGRFLIGKKPWGCDVCMTGWAAIAFGVFLTAYWAVDLWPLKLHVKQIWPTASYYAPRLLAAAGLCLLALRFSNGAPSDHTKVLDQFLSKR